LTVEEKLSGVHPNQNFETAFGDEVEAEVELVKVD
jgi:hypothetical protein